MGKIRKILMLIENCPARADNRVWAEAIALRDHGFQVSIISPKGAKKYQESYACIEGIHVYQYRLSASANKYIAYFAEYSVALCMTFWLSFKVLFRHGFDAIHTANPPDIFFMIGLFYRLLGKKFVFDQHDPAPEMFQVIFNGRMKPLYRLLLFFERCSYKTADLVITSNISQKEFAIKRGHCCAHKVFVVRNGPDVKQMKLVAPEPELKRGRRYLLAYLGVMGIQDGIEYAIYALHDLVHKRGRQDISLVLMGDGDHLPVLQALVCELQLDEYVTFTGWVMRQDIIRYLTTADLGLTPDPQNGLNEFCTIVKTMEYMAMEKPVVAFDLPETRFSAQGAALYATPNLVEDFADRIETLLDDDELRLKMGAIGRQRVEEELSWEHTKENLLLAYGMLFPESNDTQAPKEDFMETIAAQDLSEITYWEKVAKTRWGLYISEIEKRAILKACSLVTRPTKALDIGCEGGKWSMLLADFGWKLMCTDVNQETLNICKNRIPTATCVLVSPNDSQIPCDSGSIGLVLCIEVGPVIQADWFVDEAFRVLQKKGLMVGVFWNRLSFRGLISHTIASLRDSYDWYRLPYPKWRRIFCKKGFTLVCEEGCCWFPFRRESNSPIVLVATEIERLLGLRKLTNISPWIVFVAQKD